MGARSAIRETIETILIAVVLAFVIRAFVVESFVVQGPSMYPTLMDRDRLLVSKITYRFRPPRPGDIIVFREPRSRARDYIKRVVAVAGQTVEIRDGVVFVDGRRFEDGFVQNRGNSNMAPMVVPSDELFVMGDNRTNSEDSRAFGPISLALVRGKAFFRFWPVARWRVFR